MKRLSKYLLSFAGDLIPSHLPYRALQLAGNLRYAGYLLVSAISLGVDLAVFFVTLQVNVPAVQASMSGYISGLVAHWLFSSRLVFADKIQGTAAARNRQKLLFVVFALIGLAITTAMIACGLRLGFQPGLSKLVAIVGSFHVTYLLRRRFIFQ
jgi:putative flippase GtrA